MKVTKGDIINRLISLGFILKSGNKLYTTDLFDSIEKLKNIYKQENVRVVEENIDKIKEQSFTSKILVYADLYCDQFDDWISKWNQKFPSPKKSKELIGIEKNYRTGLSGNSGVKSKMIDFIIGSDFKYTLDLIDHATDKYIYREYENNNLRYLKQSGNFINKRDEGSKLEAECEAVFEELAELNIPISEFSSYLYSEDITNPNKNINESEGWTFLNA